jgi:hypothetical protein
MKTASFFDYTGPGRISIARFAPRDTPAGFRVFKALAPGPWFNSVDRAEYERRFTHQLSLLNAVYVADQLIKMAHPYEPILLCWERKSQIEHGTAWCHRDLVAAWFKREIDLDVAEL